MGLMLLKSYDINYPEHIAKGFVQMISDGLESFFDYKQREAADDPTTNHLGHKRMDEINKYLSQFIMEHENEGFTYDVVTAGNSPYQVLISYDNKRQNLILFKRVESIHSVPRNMFNSPGEDMAEYILEYGKVNRRLNGQLTLDFGNDSNRTVAASNRQRLEGESQYRTLVIITFADHQEKLVDVSIGVPEPEMRGWIDRISWREYIEPNYEKPVIKESGVNIISSVDADDQKYDSLLNKKQ